MATEVLPVSTDATRAKPKPKPKNKSHKRGGAKNGDKEPATGQPRNLYIPDGAIRYIMPTTLFGKGIASMIFTKAVDEPPRPRAVVRLVGGREDAVRALVARGVERGRT